MTAIRWEGSGAGGKNITKKGASSARQIFIKIFKPRIKLFFFIFTLWTAWLEVLIFDVFNFKMSPLGCGNAETETKQSLSCPVWRGDHVPADRTQALGGRSQGGQGGPPGPGPASAPCPGEARGASTLSFAAFGGFSVLKATDLKYYWAEGFETQVPLILGQGQLSGCSGGDRGGSLLKSCLEISPPSRLPGEGGCSWGFCGFFKYASNICFM